MGTKTGQAPRAAKRPRSRELHGETLVDDYAWLRDDNWREVMRDPMALEPTIKAHLEAENDWVEHQLGHLRTLRETLVEEMRGRIKEDDSTVPAPDGPYAYYHRFESGAQHPRYCRCDATKASLGPTVRDETVLLDCDALATRHNFYDVAQCAHSHDHALYAYAEDTKGSEIYTIRIKDLASGKLMDDEIAGTTGDFVWALNNRHLFYTVLDDNHRPSRVFRHALGTSAEADVLIYQEEDPGFFVGLNLTESRRFILIDSHDHTTSEVRLLDAADPLAPWKLVAARDEGVEYSVSHRGEQLFITTNADTAEDYKLVTCPLTETGRAFWSEYIPHRPGTLLVDFSLYRQYLVRLERENALPRIVVRHLESGDEHAIDFDEEAYSLGVVEGHEFDSATLRFSYSSPTTPGQVFDYDMRNRERWLRKSQEVPSGHRPEDYRARRIQAISHDGEEIPVTLLYHRDTLLDGSAPVLLYGYGAYGHSIPASFATGRLSLVDRGFIYAIAHVRGGMERGYRWYRTGKLADKVNTFKDFLAAGGTLVERGLTREGAIACHGGSAGGMLIGAVINMQPQLFGAAVGEVPFVDVLTTMCDRDLPLTPPEWPEWGNPLDSRAAFEAIRGYSPYDNIGAKGYPAVLATAGLTDPRVTYWEPAKWIARLRECRTDGGLSLLKTNMTAGHGGASGRFERLEETALIYAFVIDQLAPSVV